MRLQRKVVVMVCGLVVALGAGLARAQEGGPGREGPRRRRPSREDAPQVRRGGGPGGLFGSGVKAVREEMERHRKAMRDVFVGNMTLAREIGRALMELKKEGADEAELKDAAKQFAPQAKELAEKLADEFATHHKRLAEIYKPDDEAKRKELIEQLAEDIVERMVGRIGRRPPRAGGPGEGPPGGPRFRRRPRPQGEPPENF